MNLYNFTTVSNVNSLNIKLFIYKETYIFSDETGKSSYQLLGFLVFNFYHCIFIVLKISQRHFRRWAGMSAHTRKKRQAHSNFTAGRVKCTHKKKKVSRKHILWSSILKFTCWFFQFVIAYPESVTRKVLLYGLLPYLCL